MSKPVTFLQETYAELRKVVWPTRQDIIRLTLIVIFISVMMGLYIGGLDFIFAKAMEFILK
jgi:preprotein translocase subunit SecE